MLAANCQNFKQSYQSNLDGMKFRCSLRTSVNFSTAHGSCQLFVASIRHWHGHTWHLRGYAWLCNGCNRCCRGYTRRCHGYTTDRTHCFSCVMVVSWQCGNGRQSRWWQRWRCWRNLFTSLGSFGTGAADIWHPRNLWQHSTLAGHFTISSVSQLCVRGTMETSIGFHVNGWQCTTVSFPALHLLCRDNVMACGTAFSNDVDSRTSYFQQVDNLAVFQWCDVDAIHLQTQTSPVNQLSANCPQGCQQPSLAPEGRFEESSLRCYEQWAWKMSRKR